MTINIIVKCSNDTKYTVPIELTSTVLEFKEAIATQSDTPSDKQRLIYSGRVLKDQETLETYKIQDGHTVHMVRGGGAPAAANTTSTAASNTTPLNTTSTSTTSTPTTAQAQPTPQNLFTAFGAGAGTGAGGNIFDQTNPLAGFGGNPYGGFSDPNAMNQMLENPLFAQYMSAMLQNPQLLDSIISSNPQFATMAPELRTYMQSPEFRAMLSDPNLLRSMMSMSSAMGGLGGGFPAYGGLGTNIGAGAVPGSTPYNPWASFPQPANTSTTNPSTTTSTGNPTSATNPTAATPPNPFAALLNPTGQNAQTASGLPPLPNPYMDPYLMQQMLGAVAMNQPAVPQQPPEERFQVQLQQLQDMGFYDAASNIRALLATGGNVEAAIEYLFSSHR